jgi:septal ring-binding cell division protein DamX
MAERQDDGGHELRLEGVGLVLGGGVLLALLVGAFFLGRWVERQRPPLEMGAATAEVGPLGPIAAREGVTDAGKGLDHFDGVPTEKQPSAQPAEPARELVKPGSQPEATPAAAPAVESDGDFFVQVGAMRDQKSATEFIDGLRKKGYPARLFSEGEGQGRLYKVRVGGYPTRQAAGVARDRLRSDGHPGAFLWPST